MKYFVIITSFLIFISSCSDNTHCSNPSGYDGKISEYDTSMCECGLVKLIPPEQLKIDTIYMEGPQPGKSYYEIPAVNLVKSCQHFDPDFILLWLPNEQGYATYDTDHWALITFEGVSWKEISEKPLPYINCQWIYRQKTGKEFSPKGKYPLIKGWPL